MLVSASLSKTSAQIVGGTSREYTCRGVDINGSQFRAGGRAHSQLAGVDVIDD